MRNNLNTNTMSKDKITIWQDNAITKARYEMTSLEKNILYMVLAQIRKEDALDTLYYVHAKELMDITGERIEYGNFLKATRKLVQRYFETDLANGDFLQATFISSAKYLKGQGVIQIRLDPEVRPFFIELKENFTVFQLHTALTLNSKYAKRMYEILSMHKNYKDPVFTVQVDDLKRQLGIINDKGIDKYEKWTHFKKAVLDPTEKEIEAAGEISFTYETFKTGKAITKLVFTIKRISDSIKVTYDGDQTAVFGRLINQFGLRKDQARQVMDRNSLPEIHKRLYDIQLLAKDGKVANLGAYTAKTFGV